MMGPSPRRVLLESTTLTVAGYDDHYRQLQLDFCDGTRYQYMGVPPQMFQELMEARSKGGYFNRYIRGRFRYVRLVGEN